MFKKSQNQSNLYFSCQIHVHSLSYFLRYSTSLKVLEGRAAATSTCPHGRSLVDILAHGVVGRSTFAPGDRDRSCCIAYRERKTAANQKSLFIRKCQNT